jgi:tetratricopeptide (TPR) repeat protein
MIGSLLVLVASTLPSAEAPVARVVQARNLLIAKKYVELTRLVEAQQRDAAKDPAKAEELNWTLNAFRQTDPPIPSLINDWVAASPKSWAPLVARAVNSGEQATLARGAKSASQTSREEFRRMAELHTAMTNDCREVLSRDRAVCRCYVELVMAAKHASGKPDPLITQAFRECPRDYSLHVERVWGLTPRWGGSYEEMRAAIESARQAGLGEAQVRGLEAYLAIDKASLLALDGKPNEARKVLDAAIEAGPTARLFDERARLNHQLQNAAGVLSDVNAALEMSRGGLTFSPGRLKRLLMDRASALYSLGRGEDARRDVAVVLDLEPGDHEAQMFLKALELVTRK